MNATEPTLDAKIRRVHRAKILGWVPCAAEANPTPTNPRRMSWGIHSDGDGETPYDYMKLVEPADGKTRRIVRRLLDLGVDGLFFWLLWGNSSETRFQSFDAWLTLTREDQTVAGASFHELLEYADQLCNERATVYMGSWRGVDLEQFRVNYRDGSSEIDIERAFRWMLACLQPLIDLPDHLRPHIALDNIGEPMDTAEHRILLDRLAGLLRQLGVELIGEPANTITNPAQFGWHAFEMLGAWTTSRGSKHDNGPISACVAGPTLRRWTRATDVQHWYVDGALTLAALAEDAATRKQDRNLVVAVDQLGEGISTIDAMRERAIDYLREGLPKQWWTRNGYVGQTDTAKE